MNQFSNIVSYLLRRYLALLIDLMAFSIILMPFFLCYLFAPIPYNISHKNYLETFAALANFSTLGVYDVIVDTVKFIIKLFVEHVNSMSLFWTEFTQLIKQIITDELTTLSEYIIFPALFVFFRAWSESSSKQSSIGKRLLGLKVISQTTGNRISFLNSLIRNIILFFIGGVFSPIFILFTKRNQALSDIITGALIIETDSVKNPLLAALLSLLLFGGGGQIYNGQLAKGVLLIILTWILLPLYVGSFVLIIGCIDAAVMANKLQKGENIGQWQFFWNQEAGK